MLCTVFTHSLFCIRNLTRSLRSLVRFLIRHNSCVNTVRVHFTWSILYCITCTNWKPGEIPPSSSHQWSQLQTPDHGILHNTMIQKQKVFINKLLLKEKVTPKSVFCLSLPIKSLYWAKLLTEVSASKVQSIPRNLSPKKPKIWHRQPTVWNKCSVARLG